MAGTIECSNGHECPDGSRFCSTCGVKIIEPDFKCPGCGVTNNNGSKFCSSCGSPLRENIPEDRNSQGAMANHTTGINVQDDHEVITDENISTEGGVKLGDTGVIKDSTISSTTNIHQHSGVKKYVTQATATGEKCPICRSLAKDKYFECNGCNRDFICEKHRDSKTDLCSGCAKIREQETKTLCPVCGGIAKEDYFRCKGCGENYICKTHQDKMTYVCEQCVTKKKQQEIHEITFPDGSKYVGNILVGQKQQNPLKSLYGKPKKKHGKGTLTLPDGTKYSGNWEKDRKHGPGTYKFPDGRTHEGEYDNDERVGQWTYTWLDGAKAIGEFNDDAEYGEWTCMWQNGKEYVGNFKDGRKHGMGTLTLPNGSKYIGAWEDDKIDGRGTYTRPDGRKYVGDWRNGKMHGQGSLTFSNGEKYVGEFKDGKEVGGKYFHADGDATWSYMDSDGQWVNQELPEKT